MLYLGFLVGKSKLVEENSYSGHLLTALALSAPLSDPPVKSYISLPRTMLFWLSVMVSSMVRVTG